MHRITLGDKELELRNETQRLLSEEATKRARVIASRESALQKVSRPVTRSSHKYMDELED